MVQEPFEPRKHHHLPAHVYAQPCICFFTVCTHKRAWILSAIKEGRVELSRIGAAVQERWQALASHHKGLTLLDYVIMPNHFHGLISTLPPSVQYSHRHADTDIVPVIRAFKASATRYARSSGGLGAAPLWQRDFWEHVVRDEESLARIRQYIADNPLAWHLDKENGWRTGTNEFYEWLVEQRS